MSSPKIDWEVTVADGKYTLQHLETGGGIALRYGEAWEVRNPVLDNMMLAIGFELFEARQKITELELQLSSMHQVTQDMLKNTL